MYDNSYEQTSDVTTANPTENSVHDQLGTAQPALAWVYELRLLASLRKLLLAIEIKG
jgi:hypothetical protein